jgi:hypothetical protein
MRRFLNTNEAVMKLATLTEKLHIKEQRGA